MSASVIILTKAFKCGACGRIYDVRDDAERCCRCGKCGRTRDDPHRAWCTKCRAKADIAQWKMQVRERRRELAYAVKRLKDATKGMG